MHRGPDLDDLDREIRDHIDAETLENMARGMGEDDARAAAIRKFGNVTRVKEDVRNVWIPLWIDHIQQDARDAVRNVRRNPGLSLTIVVTLALGIGLTTAVYSVVNAILFRPLNYVNPARIVWLTTRGKDPIEIANSIDFAVWKEQVTSLAHIVAYDYADSTLVVGGEASRVRVVGASAGFWDVTGARPLFGQLPAVSTPPSVVLAHQVFREQFHGDPSIIGKVVMIDGLEATVSAVLPDDYRPQLVGRPFDPAFNQVPIGAYRVIAVQPPPQVASPGTQVRVLQVIGELQPTVTLAQARAELETIHDRWQREHPTPRGGSKAVLIPLRDKVVGPSRLALGVLLSASVVVLLIACVNVANLLLSRSSERRKEIALRISIGSGPLRVIRQLLAESLAYAMLGGVGGVLFAYWLVSAVIAIMGPAVPRLSETTIDVVVLAVAAGTSILTALAFGVGPALAVVFTNVQDVMKEGGRSASASRRALITGRILAGAQVAMTIVLLAGAGLMFRSVLEMTRYPDGFAPDQLLTMRIEFRGPQYRETQARHALAFALLEKARSLPGVRQAEITTGRESTMLVLKENEAFPPPGERASREAPVSLVSSGFGSMVGMSLVQGHWLSDVDIARTSSEPTPSRDFSVVINESLARRDFRGVDPVGARIKMPWLGQDRGATIVGVARDLKYTDIDKDLSPELFFHYADAPLGAIALVMRIDGDPIAAAPSIRKALSTVDPTQSFYDIRTMEQALAQSIAPRRFNLLLLGTFALVALILACIGVYGTVTYAVAERTHEIGIRLALGAKRARVVGMVVVQGMSGVVIGLIIGLCGAWATTHLMTGLIYGVRPHDPVTFGMTAVLLVALAFVACMAPATRAARVNPVIALRVE